jgi:signal transduction histidine kinase/ActR/RegA family two-component response regulator
VNESGRRERTLILAPLGRDAHVAAAILREAHLVSVVCRDMAELVREIERGAEAAVLTEEAMHNVDLRQLAEWVASQPAWSDFPFIVLTKHGGGLERNPAAAELMQILGNVAFIERPFHPTTLISTVQSSLRGRQRQYECQRLNEELESRVHERTEELGAANRQLLNQIEERERVEATLRQMQRLEAVGQLTSGVAHDFNNLLTVVLGNIHFLERDLKAAGVDEKSLQRLSFMRAAAERGARLTDQMLSFSRRQRLQPKRLDLKAAIEKMRDLLQGTIGTSVQIETQLAEDVWPAFADPTQLELAILNLAINARDAMPAGGELTVKTSNVSLGPPGSGEDPQAGDYVEICVADTGTGMSEEVQRKVFEPFFTTKEVGKGSGLGLSQVLGFAKQSSGGVRIRSAPGKGTAVHIYLPRSHAEAEEAQSVPQANGLSNAAAGARILLVDDDRAVRDVTAAMLRELGYSVLEAGSGGAALDIVEREREIDLVVVDFAMPGMNGVEVAREARARRPNLPVLFITGFADRAAVAGVDADHILGKPFAGQELAEKVQHALHAPVAHPEAAAPV